MAKKPRRATDANSADTLTLLPAAMRSAPYVVEDGQYKALHFDGRSVQSRMRKDAPDELQVGYTRVMMGFMLFLPAPRDILVVGLGGGSLSKFCFQHLPDTVVTTVEIDPDIIALREQFAIPPDDERFRVICADAALYLRDRAASADVILLDGYEDAGLPLALGSAEFYRDCHNALRPGGILAANLWGADTTLQRCYRHVRTHFAQRLLKVSSPTSDNMVAFGLKDTALPGWDALQQRARRLQRELDLDFPYVLDAMRRSAYGALLSQLLDG